MLTKESMKIVRRETEIINELIEYVKPSLDDVECYHIALAIYLKKRQELEICE